MSSRATNVVVLDAAVLKEARRLQQVSQRVRRDAEHAVAVTQLVETAFKDLLERATGLDLTTHPYQFDAEKGYLIPKPSSSSSSDVAATPSTAPISLTERRKSKNKQQL